MKNKPDQHFLDAMHKDLGNWYGPFYCNSKDPRIMVPKYNYVMGWTLNFGNKYAIIAMILILAIIIVSMII